MTLNIVTAFTPTYREHAERLIQSGKKHGHEVTAYAYPHQPDWLAGTRIKASAILRAMHELSGPILWVDADAEILRPLPKTVPWDKCDFAAPAVVTARKRIFYVASMWFKNDAWDRQLVGRWKDGCKKAQPHEGDEWLLELARRDLVNEGFALTYGFLPYSWAWVPGCDWDRNRSFVAHTLSGEAGKYVKSLSDEQKREVGL